MEALLQLHQSLFPPTDNYSILVTRILCSLIALLTLLYSVCYYWRCYQAPPGYWGIPFLGTLHYTMFNFIFGEPKRIETSWAEMAASTPNPGVMSLCMGSQRIVILHSYDAIHEALVEKQDLIVNRPTQFFYQRISNNRGIILSNGQLWKQHRRFALVVLRNLGFGKSIMEEKILFESQCLCQFMKESIGNAEKGAAPLNTMDMVVKAVSNIICQLVYGDRWDYEDVKFEQAVESLRTVTQVGGPMAFLHLFFPVLRKIGLLQLIPNYSGDEMFVARDNVEAMLIEKLNFCRIALQEKGIDKDSDYTPTSYMEAFLLEMDKKNSSDKSHNFTQEQCIQASVDLFAAGSDTTTNSISWALLLLAKYPMIQARMYQEILQIEQEHGLEEINRFELRTQMHYSIAVMDEVQRFCSIVPRSVDKQTAEDVTFRGYVIKKDDIIMTNLHHIHHDPMLWADPERFDPDRFLSMCNDGKVEYKPSKYLNPFGFGKRICLGESLAKMEYFLFLTNLVRSFRFELSEETNRRWNEIFAGAPGIIHAPLEHTIIVSNRS